MRAHIYAGGEAGTGNFRQQIAAFWASWQLAVPAAKASTAAPLHKDIAIHLKPPDAGRGVAIASARLDK